MSNKKWEEQGCEVCRQKVLSGKPLSELSINVSHHIRLLVCENCNSLWCEEERFAHVISKEEALNLFEVSEAELK